MDLDCKHAFKQKVYFITRCLFNREGQVQKEKFQPEIMHIFKITDEQ